MRKIKTMLINLIESRGDIIKRTMIIMDIICIITSFFIMISPNIPQIIIDFIFVILVLLLYLNYFFNSIKKVSLSVLKKDKLVKILLANEEFHFLNIFLIEYIILSILNRRMNIILVSSNIIGGIAIFAFYIIILVVDIILSRKIAKHFQKI